MNNYTSDPRVAKPMTSLELRGVLRDRGVQV